MAKTKKVNGKEPLAAVFLEKYLENHGKDYVYEFFAPEYLKENPKVMEVLKYHRNVFLTKEKARFTGGQKSWAGIVPRLQDGRWNGRGPLNMRYHSLVEFGGNLSVSTIINVHKAFFDHIN